MSCILELSESEIKEIQKQLRQENQGKAVLRMVLILLVHFLGVKTAVQILGVQKSAVYKRIQRFKYEKMKAFYDRTRSGRPPKMDEFQSQWLKEKVAQKPTVGAIWTCGLLANQLQEHFGLQVSLETVRRKLTSLKLSWKKPRHIAPESPDPMHSEKLKAIEEVKTNLEPGSLLLYLDQADFNMFSELRNCWQPQGEQIEVRTPGKNQKTFVFGAIDYERKHFVYRIFRRKRNKEMLLFLRQIMNRFKDRKIYVILDNYCVHHSKAVMRFLESHERLNFLFLPTYSPEENQPIERTWGTVKNWSTANQAFSEYSELVTQVKNGLQRFQRHLKRPNPI